MKCMFCLFAFCMLAGCRLRDGFMQTMILEPSQFAEYLEEKSDCMRYRRLATEVYSQGQHQGSADYGCGFKGGFVDFMMAGGTVEAPLLPPRRYWSRDYQTPEGHRAAHDWFAGYEAGAIAARDGGYRKLVTIPSTASAYMVSVPPTSLDGLQPGEFEEVAPEELPTPTPELAPLQTDELSLPGLDFPLASVAPIGSAPVVEHLVMPGIAGIEPSISLWPQANALTETNDSVGAEVATHASVNNAKTGQPAQRKHRDRQPTYLREAFSN